MVLKSLSNINTKKAAGPDGVGGKVLKECRLQLYPTLQKLFQNSIDTHHLPALWKTSEIVPVPKMSLPKVRNDLRPVALTAIVMKCFERIVLEFLKAAAPKDKFQFAYSAGRSVEDATLTLIQYLQEHLDKTKTYARVLFVDFSSAFNTIQPHILMEKLMNMNINSNIILWLKDFLTGRLQYVRFKDSCSPVIEINTGAPQGCVLSALLFTLYTSDCQASHTKNVIMKYADDTVVVGFVDRKDETSDTNVYFEEIAKFHDWCNTNYLNLNVKKTKEMVIDFGLSDEQKSPVLIDNEIVETVHEYKYLGSIIDDKLKGTANINKMCKKANQRMFFLRKLKDVNVDTTIMDLFYRSVVQSVVAFCIVCWFGNLSEKDKKLVNRLAKSARRLGCKDVVDFEEIYQLTAGKKLDSILKDESHPLYKYFRFLPSKARLSSIYCRTSRYKQSFVPSAIRLYNGSNL